ncbi:MAG: hypothetical protein ABI720_13125 [Actinomycetes bacterium]
MSPTARLTSIVAVAAFALGGAGIALASVGSSATDPAAAAVTPSDDATVDSAAMKTLNRELGRLDLRSKHLAALLDQLRGKTQQVSQRTVAAPSTPDASDVSSSPSPAPSSSPSQAATHSDDPDDAYDDGDDRDDDGYDDEHEDDEDHGGDDD